MATRSFTTCVIAAAVLFTVAAPGCSKKSLQSGGDAQSSEQGMAKRGKAAPPPAGGAPAESTDSASAGSAASGEAGSEITGIGSDFPDTTLSGETGSPAGGVDSGLRGLDSVSAGRAPSEERLGNGTMLAKVAPSESAGRQLDEIRAEQAASTAAGLRDVFFSYDSWTISEEGRAALSGDAEWLKQNAGTLIKIEGHCDERGTLAYNLVLGEKRAKAVRNYLIELGVPANRMSVVSYGKERPFCTEHAESCYQQNRRGHLVVRTK